MSGPVLLIGAGQGALSCLEALIAGGHSGPLHLIGAEPHLPYQRPPLSKAYLKGEMPADRLSLKPRDFYDQAGVHLHLDCRATAIDRAARQVALSDGQRLDYAQIGLFPGASPRRLPPAQGGDLAGVHVLRSLADSAAIARDMAGARRLLVVGGGYVGLEIAAIARAAGLPVTLIEAAPRILARVACAETAALFRDLHRRHGVEIIEGTGLARLVGQGGAVSGAQLSDGREIAADLVVTGIGVTPDDALARAAGLVCDNGIRVDSACRTSDPAIFAGGDAACFNSGAGPMRVESVPNAIAMGQCAAAGMLGRPAHHAPVPWFWSDQYDVKLQIAGLGAGHDRIVTRPGSRAGGQSLWYFRGDQLLACDALNDAKAWMSARKWLQSGANPRADLLADPACALADTLTAA